MTDEQLLKTLKDDPEEGLKLLVGQYEGILFGVVRSVLPRAGDDVIEECVADVFSEFWLDLDKVDLARGSLKAWLCVTAKHNALDILRAAKRRPSLPYDDRSDPENRAGASAEETLLERELRRELARRVRELGEPDSEIIFRKYYLAQSSEKIAGSLGMTPGGVDVRAHRALKKLRKCFEN